MKISILYKGKYRTAIRGSPQALSIAKTTIWNDLKSEDPLVYSQADIEKVTQGKQQ